MKKQTAGRERLGNIAPLFAEAIKRVNESKPLGDLFEYDK